MKRPLTWVAVSIRPAYLQMSLLTFSGGQFQYTYNSTFEKEKHTRNNTNYLMQCQNTNTVCLSHTNRAQTFPGKIPSFLKCYYLTGLYDCQSYCIYIEFLNLWNQRTWNCFQNCNSRSDQPLVGSAMSHQLHYVIHHHLGTDLTEPQ